MHISNESLLVILVVGLVAGWLAGQIVRGTGFGLIGDLIIRDSPDDSRGEVNICAFPTFPQDRRELRTAAGTWGGRNGGRRIELVILPGIWTYSSRRLLWNR